MNQPMYGLALSQSGALVLTAWAALATAVATVAVALFALFPARKALAELKTAREEARYEQAFRDALRRAWIEAHAGYDPRTPLTTETVGVIDAFTGVPGSLGARDKVDGWLNVVWPKMKDHILNENRDRQKAVHGR
jgi:hypothetical protein